MLHVGVGYRTLAEKVSDQWLGNELTKQEKIYKEKTDIKTILIQRRSLKVQIEGEECLIINLGTKTTPLKVPELVLFSQYDCNYLFFPTKHVALLR